MLFARLLSIPPSVFPAVPNVFRLDKQRFFEYNRDTVIRVTKYANGEKEMEHFVSLKDVAGTPEPGHISFSLLDETNGCLNGCCCGVSRYTETQYQTPGCHEDQEGFMVLSGNGFAKLGNEERSVCAGTAFIVPAGVEHALRTTDSTVTLEVFWFHAAC